MPIYSDPIPGDSMNNKFFMPPNNKYMAGYSKAADEIKEWLKVSDRGQWSLDNIVICCRMLPNVTAYMSESPESLKPAREFLINGAISDAIKTYIDKGTMYRQNKAKK